MWSRVILQALQQSINNLVATYAFLKLATISNQKLIDNLNLYNNSHDIHFTQVQTSSYGKNVNTVDVDRTTLS